LTVQVLRSASSYKEVGIIVPVKHGETSGVFFVALYLDTTAGVVTGREIWGFPKKDADITFTEEGGSVSTVVSRFGFPLIKATMRRQTRVQAIPEAPPSALFNLKVIPSVKRGAPPDVLQLTSLPSIQRTAELYEGPATLEFGGSPFDPLDQIPILGVVGARFEVGSMELDYGDVVFDYLAQS
jgi:acetoacetate decarboxylase